MSEKLLTREFKRDKHKCVICSEPAVDSHHIVDRKLFGKTGGYYINNGASLRTLHHWAAENTTLSCEEIREKCKIKNVILPVQLSPDLTWDKWGNQILPSGHRIPGEMFYTEPVQKILKQGNVLHLFKLNQ